MERYVQNEWGRSVDSTSGGKKSLPISFADDRPHAIDIFVCVRREDREEMEKSDLFSHFDLMLFFIRPQSSGD